MFMRRTGKREFAGRASKRGAAPNGVEIRRNDSASPTKATFARDGKKHRLLECVVPPLGGRFDGFRLKAGLLTRSSVPGVTDRGLDFQGDRLREGFKGRVAD